VDMNLNSGNGDVAIKNIFITSPVTEKLTAVKHANNNDVWIMVHEEATNNFLAYLLTSGGLITTPVTSSIGIGLSGFDRQGCMKFSADGTQLAFAALGAAAVELFNFNSLTGAVTNDKLLTLPSPNDQTYGVEFSNSGNYLYCSVQQVSRVFQWDVTSNSASIINSTRQQIGISSAPNLGSLQMGPDKKIYVAKVSANFLGVINYPDSSGVSCNYDDNAVSLAGRISRYGLPNFITSYFLSTGIKTNNKQKNQLTVSPNPATDKITISFPATTSENITIKIFSITGEVVFEKLQTSNIKHQTAIDVTGLSNGLYFLNVQTGKEVITKKIVVNH
jgi:hypothetical protein